MIVQLALFAQLATNCAPGDAVETLAAVAQTESGFDDAAIHDNSTGETYHPRTRDEAIGLATELVVLHHHSADLGLMQVNSSNLPGLGLTIADAFDACRNLSAGARVLAGDYTPPAAGEDSQPALRHALSRYNTGDALNGITNGYVTRVQASAEVVVPALRLLKDPAPGTDSAGPVPLPSAAPSWDVYGQARAARAQGGVVIFGASRPAATPTPAAVPPPPNGPLQLRASKPAEQAMNNVR